MRGKIIQRRMYTQTNVKRIAKFIICNDNEKLDTIPGLQTVRNETSHPFVRIAWILIIFTCLTTCVYQIGTRIEYCLGEPTVMDVFYEELSDGKMPSITLTTRDTEELMQFLKTLTPPMVRFCLPTLPKLLGMDLNLTVDKLWSFVNTTTIIKKGYITQNGRRIGNLSLHEYNGAGGVMTEVYYDKRVMLGDTSLKLHVLLNYPNMENESLCNNPPIMTTIQSGDEKTFDLTSMTILSIFRKSMVAIAIRKYLFLNTLARPCIDRKIFEKCEYKCYQTVYLGVKLDCRFPFIRRNNVSFCKTSPETFDNYNAIMRQVIDFNARTTCNCPAPCSKTQQTNLVHNDDTEQEHIQLYLLSSEARVMVERFAYGTLSLLCDIGGNLGLYLGLSLLSTVQLFTQFLRRRDKSLFAENGKLCKKVTQIYRSEKRNKEEMYNLKKAEVAGLKLKSYIKYFVTGLAITLCIYQTYERISYFFSYPITISIEVVEEAEIQLPSVVVCYLPPNMLFKMKSAAKNLKKNCSDVDILDLLDPPHKYANNIKLLWLETSTIQSFDDKLIQHSLQYGSLSTYPTFLGNCTKSSIGTLKYSGMKLMMTTAYAAKPMCDCNCKVFTIPVGEQFDLVKYTDLPCLGKSETRFTRQTLIRLPVPKKPCLTREDSIDCRERCFNNKMMAKIKCRLPFMMNISLPLCDSSESAKQSRQDYLDSYIRTNPSEECNCYPRCKEPVYVPYTVYDESMTDLPIGIAAFGLRNNVHEIITQNRAFPFVKLLCDIGSNLGIIVGMSVLSLIEVTQEAIYTIRKSLKKRYI